MDKIKRKIYLDKIIEFMKNDYLLFYNLKLYGFYDQLSENELNYVLSGVFEQPVEYYVGGNIFDKNGNLIYYENYKGYWYKYEYDKNGNKIYYENSYGYIEDYR